MSAAIKDLVSELAREVGMLPVACPSCGADSYQTGGFFHYCPTCDFSVGGQRRESLGDILIRNALEVRKG